MIVLVQAFGCRCDNCGKMWVDEDNDLTAYPDESIILELLANDVEWVCIADKHYCGECAKSYLKSKPILIKRKKISIKLN